MSMSGSEHRCVAVVPCYRHAPVIHEVIVALRAHGLPVIVVDDGSPRVEKDILDRLSREREGIEVLHLEHNQGKGRAIRAGFKHALSKGFTHALQIDADGQHDPKDVPLFLAASRLSPGAIVSGYPVFDESVPFARKHGRKLNTVMVYLETLSFDLRDSLCGFRLYPLTPAVELLESGIIGSRMTFDIGIAVRMMWRGHACISIPTRVTYPRGGISHYRVVRDNAEMVAMHVRLIVEMLPRLLFRRLEKRGRAGEPLWFLRRERGSVVMLRLGLRIFQAIGRQASVFFLYIIIAYFFVTGRKARRLSRAYLERVTADKRCSLHGRKVTTWLCFRHIVQFGHSLLDKMAVWNGEVDLRHLHWDNVEEFRTLVEQKKGGLVFSAHVGNTEILRSLSNLIDGLKVHALMFGKQAQWFRAMLAPVSPEVEKGILPIEDLTPDSAIKLEDLIANGEFVALLADRAAAGTADRTRVIPFLGSPAPLPEGPWFLASLLGVPVYLIFCFRRADGSYRVEFEKFCDRVELPRETRAQSLEAVMQRFAQRLEHHVLREPLQWFNFFDFWAT